jgi:hypothetical protein
MMIGIVAEAMTFLSTNGRHFIPQKLEANGCVANPNIVAPCAIVFNSSKKRVDPTLKNTTQKIAPL